MIRVFGIKIMGENCVANGDVNIYVDGTQNWNWDAKVAIGEDGDVMGVVLVLQDNRAPTPTSAVEICSRIMK